MAKTDTGITDVPSAGTPVRITTSNQRVKKIKFTALATNSGLTYVGQSDVSSTNGYPLGAAGGVDATLEFDFGDGSAPFNEFYLDAASSGDDVAWAVIFA